jgi:hypothetical protein
MRRRVHEVAMIVAGRGVVVVMIVLAIALGGCATEADPVAGDAGDAGAGAPADDGDGASSGSGDAAAGASCDPSAFLPVVRQFDDPDVELAIEGVDVAACRNGYARVYAVARENPTGHPQHENEQVFLRDVDGSWEVVSSGTGVTCGDGDLAAVLVEVCEGLGER